MTKSSALKAIRLTHQYFGLFISPAILFFALTGALQTFGLHEPNRAGTYQPPRWLAVLGHIHKKADPSFPQQRGPGPNSASTPGAGRAVPGGVPSPNQGTAGSERRRGAGATGEAASTPQPDAKASGTPEGAAVPTQRKHNTLPLKIFFLLVSLGLFTATGTGISMSYSYSRNKGLVTFALVAGVVVPLLLMLF